MEEHKNYKNNKKHKILLAGPCYEDSFVDNVKSALLSMGHEVVSEEPESQSSYWSFPRHALRVLEERILGDRPNRADQSLLALARKARPDLLLSLTWDIHPDILNDLYTRMPGRRILWWGDAVANSRRWGILNPGWDKVYLKDPEAVQKLRLAGKNTELLHEAMNPAWHRPIASQAHGDIIIAGNFYAFRQLLVARLIKDGHGFRLHGGKPPTWALPEIKRIHSQKYITREQKSRAFGEALLCLNTFHPAEGNSLNCRAFEIAGAGGLQVIEYRPTLLQCFEPGKELLAFHSYEELLEHIGRAKKYPSEMKAIREAGAKRALHEHTYCHRLRRIFESL